LEKAKSLKLTATNFSNQMKKIDLYFSESPEDSRRTKFDRTLSIQRAPAEIELRIIFARPETRFRSYPPLPLTPPESEKRSLSFRIGPETPSEVL